MMSQRASVAAFVFSLSLACGSSDQANPAGDAQGTVQGGAGGMGAGGAGGAAGVIGGSGTNGGAGSTSTSDGSAPREAGSDVSVIPAGGNSVLERNNHASRDGHFLQPLLTKTAAAGMARDTAFAAAFAGNMWASPLYLENGPGGKGLFFAVTTGNDVHAIDETTGAIAWTHNIGSSPQQSGAGCGNIHPIGILSTPVIDAQARTIYVAGAIGTAQIDRHEVHALSVDDGTERAGWPIDVSTIGAGNLQFTAPPENQRSALSLVGGILYVAYGGHIGDCGAYHGWIFAINTKDPTTRGAWASVGQREGIWAPGGLASDGTNLFAVTGNATNPPPATHADSEEVVRITGLGQLSRTNQSIYYPSTWATMDRQDADFGANNPIYLTVPGATPANYLAALAKDGHLYLLDSTNLGGMDGHAVNFVVSTGAMSIRTVPASYVTAQGVHVAFVVENGAVGCPAGSPTGTLVMSVLIPAGSPPAPRVVWCTAAAGRAAPIATTTDGTANPIVWFVNNARLTGVDGDTGQVVFNSPAADTCAGVRQWTSPIAVKGRIVVGGDGHLCSWSPR
jgi:hypothetical protein